MTDRKENEEALLRLGLEKTIQEQFAYLRSLEEGWDEDPREATPAPAPAPKAIEDAERVALALEASGFQNLTVSADVMGGVWVGTSRTWIVFKNNGSRVAIGRGF